MFPAFPELSALADAELGYSIQDLCLNDPGAKLGQTEFTQPALYVVNALTFLKKTADTGQLPNFVAGHSLGEYDALFAAGVFDFVTGLKLVKKRGELMAHARGGAMAAIIGLSVAQIREGLSQGGHGGVDLANINAPTQIVISGPEAELKPATETFQKMGAQIFPLKVSAAFHSRYMAGAQEEFERFLEPFELKPPRIPVVANVTALPYETSALKNTLARQITSPVRWTESVGWILNQGTGDCEFFECGPGNVLTGLLKRIRQNHPATAATFPKQST